MSHIEDIKTLLSNINPIYAKAKQADEEKRKRGEYFNVFNTLGLWSEEVRLHSSFLAELLNPNGNHGMGNAFLRQFLQLVIKEQPDYIQSDKVNQNIVERFIGQVTENEGGRLDIIIEDGNHAVIIENKIYAGDQAWQLLRYDNYGKKHFPVPGDYHLIYLTLDGHEANDSSTGNLSLDYIRISYSKDILDWLHQCVQLAYDKPLVRETTKQYIHLIKQLTNQDMEKEGKKAIAELAIDNIEATSAFMEARSEISKILRERFIFRKLQDFATAKHLELKIVRDVEDPYMEFSRAGWNGCISIASENKRGENHNWKNMFVGISLGKEQPNTNEKLSCFKENPNTWWPYGWEWLPWTDWHSTANYLALKQKVADWIMDKVENILQEIDEKHIQL